MYDQCEVVTYQLQCVRDRRCVVVKWRERERFHNFKTIINVKLSLTDYSVADTDDV